MSARAICVRLLSVLWVLGLVALSAAFAIDRHLQAAPGDWATTVRIGPVERRWQVAALMRLATRPTIAWLFSGRSRATPEGTWTLQRLPTGTMRATCAPCDIHARALGAEPLRLVAVAVDLETVRPDEYLGRAWLGRGAEALPVDWRVRLDAHGVAIDASAAGLPVATLLEMVEPRLAELARARIEGALSFTLHYGGDALRFEPRLEGFVVNGLGTQALLNAVPPERCGPAAAPVRGWLPVAVLAAEDQTFFSHTGINLDTLRGALQANAASESLVGGSTLTQQLAKLVYTGDRREPVRKLRELLYAAEMEQTLGKARILQLYLAIAPWGPGLCGAEQASRHYFRKPAAQLDPLQAAWLAGLLRNPDAAIRVAAANGGIDAQRTAWVLAQMRPMASWRRAYWVARVDSLKPATALPSGAKPSTNR